MLRLPLNEAMLSQLSSRVSQGSVLEAIPFIMYAADLIFVIESHGLSPDVYADDTQVSGSCRPAAVDDFSSKVSDCVGDVSSWMRSNRLSLNCDKTEVLWCASVDVSINYRIMHCQLTALLLNQ